MVNMLIIKDKYLYVLKLVENVKKQIFLNFIKMYVIKWLDIHFMINNVRNVIHIVFIRNDYHIIIIKC